MPYGEMLVIMGVATDAEDGPLTGDALEWHSLADGFLGTGDTVMLDTLSPGPQTIQFFATDSGGLTAVTEVEIEVVGAEENQPPQVTILSPADRSQVVQGTPVSFLGQALDPEEGALPGTALTWTSSQDGVLGSGTHLELTTLSLGPHLITLTAADRQNLASSASIQIEVYAIGENQPPVAFIVQPAMGTTVETGTTVELGGYATDIEDGALSGTALAWSSDRDGPLGFGAALEVMLSEGMHTVTLTATDSGGKSAGALTLVYVVPPGNTPPEVTILEPAEGATFTEGAEVTLKGQAIDPEDGRLSGAALVWTSDLDGTLGTGETVRRVLSVGSHTIRLTATDSSSVSAAAVRHLYVSPEPENQPPTAQITQPADGSSYDFGTEIRFTGVGVDLEDGTLPDPSLSWSSDRDGSLGRGATVTIASLSEGQHRITLTAMDSKGATGRDTISITIKPKVIPNVPPTARLTGPAQATARGAVTFDGSSSSDTDGAVVRYVFDFGDGEAPQDGSSPTASHAYELEGRYTVKLTVYDDDGAAGSAAYTIEVTPYVRQVQLVEDDRDRLASFCALDFTADGRAVIAYNDLSHPSLWVATEQVEGGFDLEIVEGLGLEIGGPAGYHVDMAIDRGGVVHVAALLKESSGGWSLRYGRGGANGWSLVTVDRAADASGYRVVDLALNPARNDRPEILYRGEDQSSARLATCDNGCDQAGSWTKETAYSETQSYAATVPGGLAIDEDGRAHVSVSSSYYSSGYVARLNYRVRGTDGSWGTAEEITSMQSSSQLSLLASRVALNGAGEPLVAWMSGVSHRTSSGWKLSRVEDSTEPMAYFDLVYDIDADSAWLVNNHRGTLELIGEDAGSYWVYSELGPQDNAWPSVAIDERGEARACFARDGNLMLY